jgi:hypothetical protein
MQLLGTVAFGSVKLSIIYFYRRVFDTGHSNLFNKLTLGMMIFVAIWTIAFFFGFLFDCGVAFWSNWGPLINDYSYCESTFGLTAAFTISDIISDVVIFCMPLGPVSFSIH